MEERRDGSSETRPRRRLIPLSPAHDPDKVVQGLYGRTSTPRTRTALKSVRVRVVRFGRTRTGLQSVRVTRTCTGTDGAGP